MISETLSFLNVFSLKKAFTYFFNVSIQKIDKIRRSFRAKKENDRLKDDNKSKLKIIESLTTTQHNGSDLVKRNNNSSLPSSHKPTSFNQHKQIVPENNNWQTVKQRGFDRSHPQNKENYNFESSNVFSPLYIEDQNVNVDFSINELPQNNQQIY